MVAYLLICSMLTFAFLFFVWNKDNWVNVTIKMCLFAMTIWSVVHVVRALT